MLMIPFYKPSIDQAEISEVIDTLKNGWLTTGPKSKEFERAFALYLRTRHAVAVNSCTAALHLALEAIGLKAGDSVLVPTLTFAATAQVVRYFNAEPILIDCNELDFNLDLADATEKVRAATARGARPVAILPVHYAGQIGDVTGIRRLAQRHQLKIIEDAAHCCPAYYRETSEGEWKPVGSDADISCFSFYANKPITTGEGGMACTEREEYAQRMRLMSLHGISHDAWKRFSASGSWYYEILAPGFKYNLSDIAAAIGLHQLRKADLLHQKRTAVADLYHHKLAAVEELILPRPRPDRIHSWHLYVVRLQLDKISISREQVIEELKEAGIGVSVHYLPLHMHPYYKEQFGYAPEDLPCAAKLYREMITLPNYPDMTEGEVEYVCAQMKQIIARHPRRNGTPVRREATRAIPQPLPAILRPQRLPEEVTAKVTFQQSRQWAKRCYDLFFASLGLVVLSPLFLLLSLVIKLADGGPVFYRQLRIGLNGRPFRILKFRSMIANAEQLGPTLTRDGDARITAVGRVLRKTKMDELPQLWNVLKGEMSLVGPRPEVPCYVEKYSAAQRAILRCKPGITDLASLVFREEESLLGGAEDLEQFYLAHCLPEKLRLNQQYAARANLCEDTMIILRTLGLLPAMLFSQLRVRSRGGSSSLLRISNRTTQRVPGVGETVLQSHPSPR